MNKVLTAWSVMIKRWNTLGRRLKFTVAESRKECTDIDRLQYDQTVKLYAPRKAFPFTRSLSPQLTAKI